MGKTIRQSRWESTLTSCIIPHVAERHYVLQDVPKTPEAAIGDNGTRHVMPIKCRFLGEDRLLPNMMGVYRVNSTVAAIQTRTCSNGKTD